MTPLKCASVLALCALITACGSNAPSITSRNAPFETLPQTTSGAEALPPLTVAAGGQVASSSPFTVSRINVDVPRSLSVSEANGYYPRADIVWRGDPIGDRHQQIAAIMETGLTAGTQAMAGGMPVVLDVRVAALPFAD